MEAIYSDYYPVFLYVDKYRFSSKWVYPQARVPYSLVRYILSGTAVFTLNDQSYDVGPNDVFYIPQGSQLSCAAKEELVFISIRFVGSIQFHETDMLQHLWHIPVRHSFAAEPEVRRWFESLYASAISRHNYKMLEVRGYLNLICAALAKTSTENLNGDLTLDEDRKAMESLLDVATIQRRAHKSVQRKSDPRVAIVEDYIIVHPEKNLTREELCRMADVSESTLRRLFREKTGKTIQEFVKETKMNNAARRLLVTNAPISSIAYDLGYETPSYFGKCFKEIFGLSPQEYRRQSREI